MAGASPIVLPGDARIQPLELGDELFSGGVRGLSTSELANALQVVAARADPPIAADGDHEPPSSARRRSRRR